MDIILVIKYFLLSKLTQFISLNWENLIWQTREYKYAIHGENLTCMHFSFDMKLNRWNIS